MRNLADNPVMFVNLLLLTHSMTLGARVCP